MPPPSVPFSSRPSLSARSSHTHHRSSRAERQASISTMSEADPDAEGEVEVAEQGDGEADERLYCLCQQKSYGEMIGCDNDRCEYEWVSWQGDLWLPILADSSFSSTSSASILADLCQIRGIVRIACGSSDSARAMGEAPVRGIRREESDSTGKSRWSWPCGLDCTSGFPWRGVVEFRKENPCECMLVSCRGSTTSRIAVLRSKRQRLVFGF